MTTSAHTIAKLILYKSEMPISNLKLQKLLYYVQGWSLGLNRGIVFTERIEAWIHGPVVPAVFNEYRHLKWSPISPVTEMVHVSVAVEKHVDAVLRVYGKWTAAQLESQSHTEDPWLEARKGLASNAPSRNSITPDSMRRYFSKKARG